MSSSVPIDTFMWFTWAYWAATVTHTNNQFSPNFQRIFGIFGNFHENDQLFYLHVHHPSTFGQRRALLEQIMPFWFTDCRLFIHLYPAKGFFICSNRVLFTTKEESYLVHNLKNRSNIRLQNVSNSCAERSSKCISIYIHIHIWCHWQPKIATETWVFLYGMHQHTRSSWLDY